MADEIQLRSLPPERRRKTSVVLACGCCCCCCCLHTVAGLAGGIVGSILKPKVVTAEQVLENGKPKTGVFKLVAAPPDGQSRSTVLGIYWVAVLLSASVPAALFMANESHHDPMDYLWSSLLIIAMTLPFIQVVASVLTLIAIGVAPSTMIPEKRQALGTLGRVTGLSIVGAIAGTVMMYAAAVALR